MRLFPGFLRHILIVAALAVPPAAEACSVCGGDPNSRMGQGAVQGVLVLGVIIYVMLMGMAGLFLTWILRARRLAQAEVLH